MNFITYVLLALIVSVSPALAQSTLQPGAHVPGELLLMTDDEVEEEDVQDIFLVHGATLIRSMPQIGVHHIAVPPEASDAVATALENHPRIKFVEKNFLAESVLAPNDPGYANQWHLPRISAPGAWDISQGSSSVSIAVIDSGVDPAHPDLAAKLIPGYNFLGGNTDTHDVYGHGTAVAGTAAALTDDGIGVAALAWNNSIMPLVVLNSSNSATYADIASAINYAADHGAKVINLSLGGTSSSSTLQSAVDYAWSKGAVIVAAAGNNSSSANFYPASLVHVMAVAATDGNDNPASFSNFGSWIAVAAPGTTIYTTNNGGGYGTWQGTSFSTPQVSALAALIFSRNGTLSNQQVVDLIKNNADDLGAAGFDPYYGYGRINAYRALAATPPPAAADTTPPTVQLTSALYDGSRWLTAKVSASDTESGVAKVELYIDNVLKATLSAAPWTFKVNVKSLAKGPHNVRAKAYDGAGNSALSNILTFSK
jgi:thermitase